MLRHLLHLLPAAQDTPTTTKWSAKIKKIKQLRSEKGNELSLHFNPKLLLNTSEILVNFAVIVPVTSSAVVRSVWRTWSLPGRVSLHADTWACKIAGSSRPPRRLCLQFPSVFACLPMPEIEQWKLVKKDQCDCYPVRKSTINTFFLNLNQYCREVKLYVKFYIKEKH